MNRIAFTAAAATALSLLARSVLAAPGYTIAQYAPVGADTAQSGTQGISTSGNYAISGTQRSGGANALLYTTATGTSTQFTQTTVTGTNATTGAAIPEPYAQPYSVNNNGVAFGTSSTASFRGSNVPTVWQNGQGTALPLPAGGGFVQGVVYGSNDNNQAVGAVGGNVSLNTPAVYTVSPTGNFTNALNLSTPNGKLSTAYAINNAQLVVGAAFNSNNAAVTEPYIYDLANQPNQATLIPFSSSTYNSGTAFAISADGKVVGTESFNGGGTNANFIYDPATGNTVAIPLPAGASSAGNGARGVNSSGEVVGTASGQYALPFLYDGADTFLLSDLITNDPNNTWNLSKNTSSAAYGIGDNGVIVGRAIHNGVISAFILTPTGAPVPEPTAVAGLTAAAAGLLARRRRA